MVEETKSIQSLEEEMNSSSRTPLSKVLANNSKTSVDPATRFNAASSEHLSSLSNSKPLGDKESGQMTMTAQGTTRQEEPLQ